MTIRSVLGRYPLVRSARDGMIRLRARLTGFLLSRFEFPRQPATQAVRTIYQVMLGRDPDPVGMRDWGGAMASGQLTRQEVALVVRASEEFQNDVRFSSRLLGHSIHLGRQQFIRSLPAGRRILDLGGTHLAKAEGAMVALGYPYPFEELVIVDLPSDERHALYRSGDSLREVQSRLGPVRYRYHSMTDLSGFDDESFDLVYSGQSIEHVTPEDGGLVLKQVARLLRPGGYLALDTPNGRVTRLQQDEFIDPDHKVEYRREELEAKFAEAGLEVVEAKGLNYAGRSLAAGRFDADEVAGNAGVYAAAEDCYILCFVGRKPPLAG